MKFFDWLGRKIIARTATIGHFAVFSFECIKWAFVPPFRISTIMFYIEKIGIESIAIVALSTFTTGMILGLQLVNIMRLFGAETFAGAGVAFSMSRELAPVITAIVLIAKNGSAMTAEIGSMKVTEQIDALETMAVNPLRYLVIPRIFASVLAFPALTALANVFGIYGGYFVSTSIMQVSSVHYLKSMYFWVDPKDIWSGLIKAAFFGVIVAAICCFYGLRTKGGAKGVGDSTTLAVVVSTVSILIVDYLLTYIFITFFGI
jgi:phospholipid/cholesterol/gamma-HCH transport system permease protein